MPWQPLPRIAFAVAIYPFAASSPADLPLELGDELYIIEETPDGNWLRGYLVSPPSLLAGLTSVKGQTLEARVFSGIFPRSCVEVREVLGESDETDDNDIDSEDGAAASDHLPPHLGSDSAKSGLGTKGERKRQKHKSKALQRKPSREQWGSANGAPPALLSMPVHRDPNAPRPPAPVPMLKIGDETPTSASEPLIDEIASCLREWHSTNLHELLLSRQYGKLETLSQLIVTLTFSRQQFLHDVLTTWEYENLRERTVWDLVRVNKLCGGEVIVRDPHARGRVLTGDDSVVEITRLQSIMSLLDETPTPTVELTALHHLLVDIKGLAGASTEATTLVLYLATKSGGGPLTTISESYVVEMSGGGQMGHLTKNSQMRTLFSDLTAAEIGDVTGVDSEIYLIVKIRAPQQVVAAKPSSRSGSMSQTVSPYTPKDSSKPPLSSGNKSMRRSLMWAGKNTRSAFSRGNNKLDSLSEQPEEVASPNTAGAESREGGPPSTANSRTGRSSVDGYVTQTADRTVGVGALRLNSVMKQDDEVEQIVSIWAPSPRFATDRGGDDEWDPVIREVLDSKPGSYEKSRRAERLQVHLRAFNNPDADSLIKATPTVLSGICKTNKMGFSGAPTKPRSDIYLTVDEAILSRHTLLSRYGGSPASIPNSIHGNNLQITLEVRRQSGERIDNCIFPSSNTDGISTWKTVATDRGEPWHQTIKLVIPPADVNQAHVVMQLADAPSAPFAVAYMPLWDQQAFIHDGPHGLLLYRLDENTVSAQPTQQGKGGYMSLPFTSNGKAEHQAEVTGPLAMVRVETYLCSTKFSQDKTMLKLLQWTEAPQETIPGLLKQFIFVAEIEVVKLLSDVLDALFGILVQYAGNDDYEDLVFTALVRVLGVVHDRRFNLAPLVDQYAESKFNYPFATPCLVRSFTRLLVKPTEPEIARKLRATFKVARHILKFITHARGQQKAKEAGIGITSTTPGFTRHLRSIFKALDAMMRSPSPVLVGSQTLAVQHFHSWLPELAGLLTTEEILHIAIDFMDSCSGVKGKLVLYKLVLIINYAKLDIFSHPEQRSALSANTVRWIAPHWGHTDEVTEQWKDQVRLCCSVLASQVDHLGPEIPDYIPKILQSYLSLNAVPKKPKDRLSLLFPTSYPFPSKAITEGAVFDEALIELSAVLSALSTSPSGMQLELAEDDLNIVVETSLRVHMSILRGETFPANWLSVHIFHHKSTMRTLQYLASILLESFLPHPDEAENFNTELWKLFFTTLLKLVGSPSLALETFPEQKRRAVWKIAGDVREHGAELLRRTWEAIGWETSLEERARYGLSKMGGYQVQYVPTLVGPIVELCLSVHEGLRRMAVEVLQTMIVSEWTLSEDLSVIQTEMIDCLDVYFKEKPLTESILQKLFVGELLERFNPLSRIKDEPLYQALRELMGTIDEFLDLLVAVHSEDGSGEASHLIHRLRLMEFLRDMQKEEIFVRYVHQLANLQAEARNHAEAGLALRLHADLYDWDPLRTTPPLLDPEFPAQTHFERKERIYFDMIKHFEEGEAWSSALDAYKELQNQYETNVFDFAKLARTERAIANIYETIAKSDKLVPKYFKVVYKGLGFPTNVRDKAFVFEGSPAERTGGFTDRMQEMYPSAQIVLSEESITDVEGQFLVVSALSPHRDLGHHVFQRARVPQIIRDYLVSSHPQNFSVSSRRNTTGPVEEHYAEKIIYTTAEPFPTILRRSEIVAVHEVRLSAKETALERIVRKTAEMSALEKRVADGELGDDAAQLLFDAVSISVNVNSESSVVCYRDLIPGMSRHGVQQHPAGDRSPGKDSQTVLDDEEEMLPELDSQENAIKMALVDHAILLKRCLATIAKCGNEGLSRHMEDLQKFFESTYAPEIAIFTPAQPVRETGSNTPSPTWPRSPPSTTGGIPRHSASNSRSGGPLSLANGVTEEAAVIQPVRQSRGARLSFLGGGRKKDQQQISPPLPTINGGETYDDSPTKEGGKENRRSFISGFRSQHAASNSDANTNNLSVTGRPSLTVQTNGMEISSAISPGGITGGSHITTATTSALTNRDTATNDWVTDSAGGSSFVKSSEDGYGYGTYGGGGGSMSGAATAVEPSHHGAHASPGGFSFGVNGEGHGTTRQTTPAGTPKESNAPSASPGGSGMGNSVRKRLSILRLGKKSSKEGGKHGVELGGVDEE
ncbi:putative dedicator of cytokinesis protein 1 [Podospora australis]|uniref:Dedicator of cytokinesis protein 1 n=1 Tax=Podospora australis TaxID=1536484 RepID=A0AAN6WPI2_9PEZI|nr:putative dedicator of cytokinesis protein 1 [Podospora australis]